MPTLVEIHPVVLAPNGNKQTNKQTPLFYIYRLPFLRVFNLFFKKSLLNIFHIRL